MRFSYDAYTELIELLKEKGYLFGDYTTFDEGGKTVILRHDVDSSVEKAYCMAKLEKKIGVYSTFFFLLSGDVYNLFSKQSRRYVEDILMMNHRVGLHFDETVYPIGKKEDFLNLVEQEAYVIESCFGLKRIPVSFHRPSQWILEKDLDLGERQNTYSRLFFENFKYVSDSRMYWREDVFDLIKSGKHPRIQLLTHPFWYSEKEVSMRELLQNFIQSAAIERYDALNGNFRDLAAVLKREEV